MKKTATARKRATKRDLNAELLQSIADVKAGRWARKTEFTRRADGSWRRRIVLTAVTTAPAPPRR